MEDISAQNNAVTPIDNSASSPQSLDRPKKNKPLIIALSFFLLISLISTGVFAYLYFSNSNNTAEPQKSEQADNNQQDTAPPNEEVEITDSTIKDDLDRKIAILFDTDETGQSLAFGYGFPDDMLFHNGDVTESVKVASIIEHTLDMRPLTEEETASAISYGGFTGEKEQDFRQNYAKGVDADQVVKKYQEIFGKKVAKGPIAEFCGSYVFNPMYDFYHSEISGCGGTSPIQDYYYKSSYTADDEHAYVYTSSAILTFEDPTRVYCDIADLGPTGIKEGAEVCLTLQSDEEADNFKLDSSNYEQFSKYRFVFDKADDGNYYFNQVEKL